MSARLHTNTLQVSRSPTAARGLRQSLRSIKDTSGDIIISEIYCGRTSFDSAFVVVFASQFFTVAGPSVGAVKHSGVFSCDWDSLEEESVRHGALAVCALVIQ